MAKIKRLLLFAILFFGISQTSSAQYGFTNEIGVFTGAYNLQSDFGERGNFESATNTGFSFGIVHYINFSYRRSYSFKNFKNYFNEHFKIRSELSWNKTNLEHYGRWVDDSQTSANADRLRAHSGESQNFNIGSQLEFFPYDIRSFENGNINFTPYVGLGVQAVFYNPKVFTSYNGDTDISNLDNFYLPWQVDEDPFVSDDPGITFSITGSVGTRYKVTPLTDIALELKWQYYFSDFIDGLDHKLPSNQSNDWAVWLNLAYIMYWER